MKWLLLTAVLLPPCAVMAKPALDLDATHSWPEIRGEQTSADGRYVEYIADEPPAAPTLTLRSTHGEWHKEMAGFIGSADLAPDGRRAIILHSDTHRLEIIELGSDNSQSIEEVDSYQLPMEGDGQWVAYRRSAQDSGTSFVLVVRNLGSGLEQSYADVTQYQFSRDG